VSALKKNKKYRKILIDIIVKSNFNKIKKEEEEKTESYNK
jgi:hypothetical protein